MMLAAQLGAPASGAEPTPEQLGTISNYLEANDVQGLRTYLKANPDLSEGNTPLAGLLRRFLVESLVGNDYFRYRNALDSLSDAQVDSDSSPSSGAPPGAAY